jgi:trans-aconitate 2-methyltransferase
VDLAEVIHAVDLGCGPGNSTALLTQRFPQADVLGIDSSVEMLTLAGNAGSGARFGHGDMNTWVPAAGHVPQLIFSNAALQWAADPEGLAARLFGLLPKDGVMAFQVPQNFDQPSHLAIADSARLPMFAETHSGVRNYDPGAFARASDYAQRLIAGGGVVDVWTTEYVHVLTGPDPVFAWLSGTALRPYFARLQGDLRKAFDEEVKARLAIAYPEASGPAGTFTLFPFRRLFVVATRPTA